MSSKRMSTPWEVKTFRSPRWVLILAASSFVSLLAMSILSYRSTGPSWVTMGLLGLLLFAFAGFVDSLTQRIELHDGRMVVVRNLCKSEFLRSEFVKAQWSKGVAVSLQRANGGWLVLPSVGSNSQGLANTLRTWLRS
jgi:hypothetical protein